MTDAEVPGGDATTDSVPESVTDQLTDPLAGLLDDRRRLAEQTPQLPLAFGLGGRRCHVIGPLGGGLALGGLVMIDDGEFAPMVGMVEVLEIVERPLGEFEATTELGLSDGTMVRAMRATPMRRIAVGDVTLLGRLGDGGLDPTVRTAGFEECLYRAATPAESQAVLGGVALDVATIEVGVVSSAPDVIARLRSTGFTRHTFLCGQSGSGKTYATGVLLEQLRTSTSLPLIVLDPNSDHVRIGEVRDEATNGPAADRYRSMADDVLVARARGLPCDRTLVAHFSDMSVDAQAQLLGLEPVADLDGFAAFRSAIGSLAAPYSLRDVIDAACSAATDAGTALSTRIENLGVAEWGVWCRPGEASLVEVAPLRRPCAVLDLGSLELPSERLAVAVAVLRSLWARRDEHQPVLIVVDEAHNVFPAQPTSALERSACELGAAIAAEGRKYGLHLLVATQRPSKVSLNVVSQCDNLALLKMNSVSDVEDLCRLFSHVPPALIRQAPEARQGEVLFAGPISGIPLRVQIGRRLSPEGGGDLPADWATLSDRPGRR